MDIIKRNRDNRKTIQNNYDHIPEFIENRLDDTSHDWSAIMEAYHKNKIKFTGKKKTTEHDKGQGQIDKFLNMDASQKTQLLKYYTWMISNNYTNPK
jgi:hypothetical protein